MTYSGPHSDPFRVTDIALTSTQGSRLQTALLSTGLADTGLPPTLPSTMTTLESTMIMISLCYSRASKSAQLQQHAASSGQQEYARTARALCL